VAPLLSGHSDVAIGSRLTRSARVIRGPKRELISRAYNTILHATLSTRFSDAQCGFKAIRADRALLLLPYVEDTGWFFDTELLVLAERAGMRIHEVPVDWVDDADSRVDIVRTAIDDLKGVARMARGLATGRIPIATVRDQISPSSATPTRNSLLAQAARFAAIGVLSTSRTSCSISFFVRRCPRSSPTRLPYSLPPSPTPRQTVTTPSAFVVPSAR
jgi:hypothetical protein